MSCQDCDDRHLLIGSLHRCYYTWHGAKIAIVACGKHLVEIITALDEAQENDPR